MVTFFRTFIVVYILAINVFGFMLVLTDKRHAEQIKLSEEDENAVKPKRISKGNFIFTAFLGGALGIYLSLFILKHKTNNLFLMITMPLILVINVYCFVFLFSNTFGIILPSTIT